MSIRTRMGLVVLVCLALAGCASQPLFQRTVAVVDDAGRPVEKATVVVVGKGFTANATTDRDGSARVRAPAAPVSMVVHKSGYDPTQVNGSTNVMIKVLLLRSRP